MEESKIQERRDGDRAGDDRGRDRDFLSTRLHTYELYEKASASASASVSARASAWEL